MDNEPIKNILKVREDSEPLTLEQSVGGDVFSINNEQDLPSWLPKGRKDEIKIADLRIGIEPWLTSLFQSEHLSLLTGTGLSIAVQCLAVPQDKVTSNKPNSPMSEPELDTNYDNNIRIKAKTIAKKNKRGGANIEDYIRVINELLRGLEVLGHDSIKGSDKEKYDKLENNLKKIIEDFANSITEYRKQYRGRG